VYLEDRASLTGLDNLYIGFRSGLLTESSAGMMIHPDPQEQLFMERLRSNAGWFATCALLVSGALAQGPLSAKINVTPVAVYTGTSPLPKPQKILVYDYAVNPDDVQVDKLQALRPRHLITGDESQDKIAAGAGKKYYLELIKALKKTGIPVEQVTTATAPPDNAMLVQGSFTSLKQGTKAERDTIGMGTGNADFETKVDVHLKTPADTILLSQFQTDTKPGKNAGSALPMAAGLNPAAAVTKSTITDRKKTLNAYASKTADATAKEIFKSMAAQGWIKTNDKGELAE
jgi:hypothetical protein